MTIQDQRTTGAANRNGDTPLPLAGVIDAQEATPQHTTHPATEPQPTTKHSADARPAAVRTSSGWLTRNRAAVLFGAGDVAAVLVATVASGIPAWVAAVFALTLVALLASGGLFRSRFTISVLDDAPALVGRGLVAGVVTLGLQALVDAGFVPATTWLFVVVAVVSVLLGRVLTYLLVRSLRARRRIAHRALIVGAGMVGQDLALAMGEYPRFGLIPVGFVDDAPLVTGQASAAPVLGGTGDLHDLICELDVDQVVIAFSSTSGESLVEVIRTADRLDCEISVVPRLFELANRGSDTDELNGMPLNRLRRAPFRSPTWPLKRVLDVVVAGTALVLLSPLLALIALTLRLTDGHGVIFRQKRIGIDGHEFELLKFRSMRPADEAESGTKWNIKDDDRVGPLGRLLRRTSLDELPQLWNIVRGDMSLVGPRPERPYFVDAFRDAFPRYEARHRVPCGLTGWAQIHGLRGDTSIEDRARFDNYYIENWSLWLDITIILRTIGSLTRGSG